MTRLSLLFFILLVALFVPVMTVAEPYHPDKEIRILSEYAPSGASLQARKEEWKVGIVEGAEKKGWELGFFVGNGGTSGAPVCRVRIFPREGEGRDIAFQAQGMGAEEFPDIMVLSDFPAPCDVLPVEQADADKVYPQKRTAGGAIFTKNYKAVREVVSAGEALQKGWIKEGVHFAAPLTQAPLTQAPLTQAPLTQAPLTMISILDARERLVVRQLWPQGACWWLYEENGPRRSWLICNE